MYRELPFSWQKWACTFNRLCAGLRAQHPTRCQAQGFQDTQFHPSFHSVSLGCGPSQHSHRLGALLRVASSADGFGLGEGTAESSVHHLAVQPPAAAILSELGP